MVDQLFHFHTAPGRLPYTQDAESLLMVSVTDMKIITERWKKGISPLKIQDMEYGNKVVRMLEKYKGEDFGMFDDPLEVTTFILLVGMLREQEQNSRGTKFPGTIPAGPDNTVTVNE